MEGSYACNLNNRFELFLDAENDPSEILAKAAQDKRKPGDKKDAKKDTKKKGLSKTLVESVKTIAAVVESNPPTKPLARQNNNTRPDRRNNDRAPRPESGTMNDRPVKDYRGGRPEGNRGPRQFGRGDGQRGNGERGDGQRGGGRGREFDRRSGDVRSGVKSVEKRGGQGQYNWGSPADANEIPENETSQENPEVDAEGVEKVPQEPEVIEKTLEQWKKEQAAKISKASYAGNIRKPNEGEKDDPKLKKAIVLKKKKTEESDDAEDDDEESEDECEKMKRQLEQTLASQFHFADQKLGPLRGGRPGGRPGGPPGRRGHSPQSFNPRREPRQDRTKQQNTPRVEDLDDFPSLAA